MATLLLKGGIVLIHGEDDKVKPTEADILIEGSRIKKIGPSLAAPSGCNVIDCTDKIISPGFIDTHHHLWQAPLKGLLADLTFIPYMATSQYSPYIGFSKTFAYKTVKCSRAPSPLTHRTYSGRT